MPSTPLRSDPALSGRVEAGAPGPEIDASEVLGAGDTERPPSVSTTTNPFGSEPASGVGAVRVAAGPDALGPGEATRVGPLVDPRVTPRSLQAALPPVTGPRPPSSARLVAAPPAVMPDVAPSKPRVPTMLGAGLPPIAPPPVAPPKEPMRGPATVPAPPPDGSSAPGSPAPGVVSVITRESNGSFGDVPLTRRCTSCETRYPADFLVCPRDATPLVDESSGAAEDPLVGKLIGDTYQIVRVVGEGGMGRVYEARHLRLKERRFAVKTLHADLARNTEIVARFMREAESASSLSHPHVVSVFDVHHLPDGTPYFVAELLEGEELADYVKARAPLDARTAASVGRQVCRALAAAHARGIVHRDMKPENIFVLRSSIEAMATGEAPSLTVKVLDFGISKAGRDDHSHLTKTGVIMGTPSYMSPEQARGKVVDLRADIYSLGAVLYYAITGRRPFDSDDPTSTISMVLTQDPVRPRAIDPRIPEALELVVQRAMAKEPRDRFQTMGELERALAPIEDGGRLAFHGASPMELQEPESDREGQAPMVQLLSVARRMFAPSVAPASSVQSGSLARVARPTILVTSTVLGAWLVGGTTASLAGLVRVLHDGEITLTECVLLVVGCLFAAATPAALYVLHVKKVIWPNSVRALQLAADLKRTATAALVTYGLLSIVARIGHTILWRSSKGLTSGLWDIALFLLSLAGAATVGGLGPLLRNLRRRRSTG